MKTTISARLPEELRERLEAAAVNGVTKNRLIIEGLEMRLARAGQAEPDGILRLAGIVKGPKDLSHGKAHRAAWGKARP